MMPFSPSQDQAQDQAQDIALLAQVIAEAPPLSLATDVLERISFVALVSALLQVDLPPASPVASHLYQQWISFHVRGGYHPHGFAAYFSLGLCLESAGELSKAAEAYRLSLQQEESPYKGIHSLASLYEKLGHPKKALILWQKNITIGENRTQILNECGYLMNRYRFFDEAISYFRESLEEDKSQSDIERSMNIIIQKSCRWEDLAETVLEPARKGKPPLLLPFGGLALFDDIVKQGQIAESCLVERLTFIPERLSPPQGYRHDKIRVGYMSGEFIGDFAMTILTAELFERHDRRRFEIYGYCNTEAAQDSDIGRKRVLAAFDQCFLTSEMSAEAAARLIRSHEIDLLVDLSGLTGGGRPQILRWKPAPVQITYLGYIGPIPIPELDYILCDDYVIPPEMASLYQPQPLSLGSVYQANDTKLSIGAPSSREAKGLPADGFVYCCFTASYKITEKMFDAWLEILQRTPGSVLWLAEMDPCATSNLQAATTAKGVHPERLIFAKKVSPADYLAQLPLADLSLAAFPYGPGTLASDALRMGVPLLTLEGKSFVARMAGSLLTSVGLSELIAPDLQAYMDMAVELAHNRTKLEGYRAHLQAGAWQSSLGNMTGFMESLERTYHSIVRRKTSPELSSS